MCKALIVSNIMLVIHLEMWANSEIVKDASFKTMYTAHYNCSLQIFYKMFDDLLAWFGGNIGQYKILS